MRQHEARRRHAEGEGPPSAALAVVRRPVDAAVDERHEDERGRLAEGAAHVQVEEPVRRPEIQDGRRERREAGPRQQVGEPVHGDAGRQEPDDERRLDRVGEAARQQEPGFRDPEREAVGEDEVDDGEYHANDPPD